MLDVNALLMISAAAVDASDRDLAGDLPRCLLLTRARPYSTQDNLLVIVVL